MRISRLSFGKMLGDLTFEEISTIQSFVVDFIEVFPVGKKGVSELRKLCNNAQKKFTVCIEGNIGCGKTTLLRYFESCKKVETIREPVDKWTDLNGHNVFKLLYENPSRWNFSFNNYAMLTRVEMHKHIPSVPVKMLERSLHSTRNVFVENSYRSNCLTKLEYSILSDWYDHLVSRQCIDVDLFVYLRASPEICYGRIKKRNRKEESTVPLEFLQDLHNIHEDWLVTNQDKLGAPVLVLDASHEMMKMTEIYDEYKSQILCGYA